MKKTVHDLLRGLRLLRAYVTLVRDPDRLDVVFALADATVSEDEAERALAVMEPAIRARLPELGAPPTVDLEALRRLPTGTFGRAVADFFDDQGFDPAGLHHHAADDLRSDFDRFRVHMERTHDLWHVVTGFATDVAGELGLQAFTLAQIGPQLSNLLLSAGFLNTLFRSPEDGVRRMEAITTGWRMGRAAQPFFAVDWAAMWTWPLEQVREALGVPAAAVRAAADPAQAAA